MAAVAALPLWRASHHCLTFQLITRFPLTDRNIGRALTLQEGCLGASPQTGHPEAISPAGRRGKVDPLQSLPERGFTTARCRVVYQMVSMSRSDEGGVAEMS